MVALWMGYATLVTVLLAGSAWAADHALARLGRARRWVWMAAVGGAFALPAAAAWQATEHHAAISAPVSAAPRDFVTSEHVATNRPRPALGIRTVHVGTVGGDTPGTNASSVPARVSTAVPTRLFAVVRAQGARAAERVAAALASLDGFLITAWLLASFAGAAIVARGMWMLHAGRRTWRLVTLDGGVAWLTPDLGPAVVGVVQPRIVLPGWVVDELDEEALRLVLAHERAHVRSRDPLLLAAALYAVLLMPWNVALWGIVRRLRLAVEADCDQRVLSTCVRAGGAQGARRYARVLVDLAEHAMTGRGRALTHVLTTALLDPPGALERRVTWVVETTRRAPWPRALPVAALFGSAGGMFVAFACATPAPRRGVPRPVEHAAPNAAEASVAGANAMGVGRRTGPPAREGADAESRSEVARGTATDRAVRHIHAAPQRMGAVTTPRTTLTPVPARHPRAADSAIGVLGHEIEIPGRRAAMDDYASAHMAQATDLSRLRDTATASAQVQDTQLFGQLQRLFSEAQRAGAVQQHLARLQAQLAQHQAALAQSQGAWTGTPARIGAALPTLPATFGTGVVARPSVDTNGAIMQARFRAAAARFRVAARELERARREQASADSALRAWHQRLRQVPALRGRAVRAPGDVHAPALVPSMPAPPPAPLPLAVRQSRPRPPVIDTPTPERLRALIARYAPQAVTGQLGTRRTVWLLLGDTNQVLRAVAERADSGRGTPMPNAVSMRRTFPELGAEGWLRAGSVQWIEPRDTLQVIWAARARGASTAR